MSALVASHVAISLVAIAAGFVVTYAFLAGKRMEGWTSIFLATTIATSASGFLLPADRILPSHVVGVISLIALTVAVATRNDERQFRAWSRTYIVSALTSFYLNMFVLVVQLFLHVPSLKALAPTQTEPAFAIAQVALLTAFFAVGYLSMNRNRTLHVSAIYRVLAAATS